LELNGDIDGKASDELAELVKGLTAMVLSGDSAIY